MDREKLVFRAAGEYPSTQVKCHNAQYGREMLDNLGGERSEMSAVSLYFYDHLMTNVYYEEIGYIFYRISMVEMHHMRIFGQLAQNLGEDPRLWSGEKGMRSYWNAGYNSYPADLCELMQNALYGELSTIDKYKQQLHRIEEEAVRANLERIILDEELHVEIFRQLMQEYRL